MKHTPEKWVKIACERANQKLGSAKSLLSKEQRLGFAATELLGIFSTQEHANGEHMREASSLLIEMFEEENS